MYSIYDDKAKAYVTPFFLPNDDLAIRAFSQSVCNSDHQFNLAPADFTLFHLGSFNVLDGVIEPSIISKSLGNGVLFVNPQNPEEPPQDV